MTDPYCNSIKQSSTKGNKKVRHS